MRTCRSRTERSAKELELVADVLGGLDPELGILLERSPDDAREIRRKIGSQGPGGHGIVTQDRGAHVGGGRAREGSFPRGELVENDPKGEQIGARIDSLAAHLLGRHVANGADDLSRRRDRRRHRHGLRCVGHRLVCELREAEVEDLHPPLASDHDVRRLQIAMNDAALVRGREGVGEGDRQIEDVPEREPARDDQLIEAAALHELHRQKPDAAALFRREEGHDVRMVEASDGPRLALETRETVRGRSQVSRKDLDCDLAPQPGVASAVDLAHSPGAEGGDDLVGPETGSGDERHPVNLQQHLH
jgi:hypothetical protein